MLPYQLTFCPRNKSENLSKLIYRTHLNEIRWRRLMLSPPVFFREITSRHSLRSSRRRRLAVAAWVLRCLLVNAGSSFSVCHSYLTCDSLRWKSPNYILVPKSRKFRIFRKLLIISMEYHKRKRMIRWITVKAMLLQCNMIAFTA